MLARGHSKRVLLVVEGARREPALMERLFEVFVPYEEHEVVPLCMNVHDLLEKIELAFGDSFEDLELLGALRELYPEHAQVLSGSFTDVYLVFDFDPQDNRLSLGRLKMFQELLFDSTDAGMLYLNYPAVESYRDFDRLGDIAFLDSSVSLDELERVGYKQLVAERANGLDDISRINALQFSEVLAMHAAKAQHLVCGFETEDTVLLSREPDLAGAAAGLNMSELLSFEAGAFVADGRVYPCCTCLFFISSWSRELNGAWRKRLALR